MCHRKNDYILWGNIIYSKFSSLALFFFFFLVLCRLNALSSLGDEFYPTSTKPKDICTFRRCVEKYQAWARVVSPCEGGGGRGGGEREGGDFCALTQ